MDPAMNHTECHVLAFRYRHLLVEAEQGRRAAAARPTPQPLPTVSVILRQQLGMVLVWTGQRLRAVDAALRKGQSAVASDPA
jgi:hypothetical protein